MNFAMAFSAAIGAGGLEGSVEWPRPNGTTKKARSAGLFEVGVSTSDRSLVTTASAVVSRLAM